MWGGGCLAAARRAGRYGLGMLATRTSPGCTRPTRRPPAQHGHEPGVDVPAGPRHPFGVLRRRRRRQGVGRDRRAPAPRRARVRGWNPGNDYSAGFSDVHDGRRTACQARRRTGSTASTRPWRGSARRDAQPVAVVRRCATEIAWPYLKRVGEVVLPEAATVTSARCSRTCITTLSISRSTTIRTRSGSGCATKRRCTTTRSTTSTR